MRESDELVYRFLDRDLDEAGCARLAAWLAEDPAHQRRFALLASEQHLLREQTRRMAIPPAEDNRAHLMSDLLSMEQSASAETVAWVRPKPKPEPHRRPHAHPRTAPRAKGIVIPRWGIVGTLAAAALITLAFVFTAGPTQPEPPTPPGVVEGTPAAQAVIESRAGVVWNSHRGWDDAPGERLPTGAIELAAGRMTIRFDSGATVAVEGPCTFHVENGRVLRLERGRAVVRSTDRSAGFTVNTGRERLVDHGTTFGVSAGYSGTRVQVFRGELEVFHSRGSGGGAVALGRVAPLESCLIDRRGRRSVLEFDTSAYEAFAADGLVPRVARHTVTVREGMDGYSGTVDTWFSGREVANEVSGFPEGAYLRVGAWAEVSQQSVLRFEGLVGGDTAPLPGGARVLEAVLVLHNARDIRDSFGSLSPQGDAFAVHRLLAGWEESAGYGDRPWSGAPTAQVDRNGREAAAAALDDCRGLLSADAGYIIPAGSRIELDVTPAVAAWAGGEPNHGFLLQSLGGDARAQHNAADGEGDAIFLASSEYATDPSLRPALIITYLTAEEATP